MDQKSLNNLQISELALLNESLERSNNKKTFDSIATSTNKTVLMSTLVIVSLIVVLIVNFTLDVYQSYLSIATTSQFIALSYVSIYLIAIIGILVYIIFSIKSYFNLKEAFYVQEKTLNIQTYEEEQEVALSILNHYQQHQSYDVKNKATFLHAQIKSNSVHSPFNDIKKEIINPLDQEAVTTVYTSAKEVSLFTAFAPGSALDSFIVIYTSLKLMKKIFLIYGYRTNLFTSILIIRKILENASIAALVEYTDDSVNDLLGNTLLSKLSVKIAQGVGNGVLMLRIGNIIIQSARPFASDGSIGSYKHMVKLFIEYIKNKAGKK